MKTYKKIAATLAAVASILMIPGANARHLGTAHDDGIAASPKVRQALNEQAIVCICDAGSGPADAAPRAASPKAQAFLDSFERTPGVALSEDTVNRQQMAMSPKVHQFLTERGWHPVTAEIQTVSLETEAVVESEPEPLIDTTDADNPYFDPDMPDNPDSPVNPDYPDNTDPDFNQDYKQPDTQQPDVDIPDAYQSDPDMPDDLE